MTNRNDMGNWMVIALGQGSEFDAIISRDQAENIARKYAEDHANANPGVVVCVFKREGTVQTVPTAKWE